MIESSETRFFVFGEGEGVSNRMFFVMRYMGDIRVALATTSSFSAGGGAGRMLSSSTSASSLTANVCVESLASPLFLGGSVVGATPISSSSIISC